MRFLVKVNIPSRPGTRQRGRESSAQPFRLYLRIEARGRLFHGQQWSADGFSFPRNAGRLTDPRDCRALVPCIQRQY